MALVTQFLDDSGLPGVVETKCENPELVVSLLHFAEHVKQTHCDFVLSYLCFGGE